MFKIPDESLIRLNNVVQRITPVMSLFMAAGVESTCDVFLTLARSLEEQRIQCYGLQWTSQMPTDSLQSLAKDTLERIEQELTATGTKHVKFTLLGYSFGGIVAIEMARTLEQEEEKKRQLKLDKLILFDSSHMVIRMGSLSNAKHLGFKLSYDNIFAQRETFQGVVTVLLSTMLQRKSYAFKSELWEHLKAEPSAAEGLDETLACAFKYVRERKLLDDLSAELEQEMTLYVKFLAHRINLTIMYEYAGAKLKLPVALVKPPRFIYRDVSEFYVYDRSRDTMRLVEFNLHDYNLSEICENLDIERCSRGSHWTFIEESRDEILAYLVKFLKISNNSRL